MPIPLLSIVQSIAITALKSAVPKISKKVWERFYIGEDLHRSIKDHEIGLSSIVTKVTNLIELRTKEGGDISIEEIGIFINTPEVNSLFQAIITVDLAKLEQRENLGSIKKLFLKYFSEKFGTSKGNQKVANELWSLILKTIEIILQDAILDGNILAMESSNNIKFKILAEKLDKILECTKLSKTINPTVFKKIETYAIKYAQAVAIRCDEIEPFQAKVSRKLRLDDLYVTPKIIFHESRIKDNTKINFHRFFENIHRTVILGDPGGGKSTLSKKICALYAATDPTRTLRNHRIPILVVLREYSADRKQYRRYSILEHIKSQAVSRYQMTDTGPENTFEYLLSSGKAIVIFDGLDELLATSERKEIRTDVESFCNNYPHTPVLVTSRRIGYSEAPLDSKVFSEFLLSEFDSEDINSYVKKWFSILDDLTETEKTLKSESFLKESETVNDLCSNPLMLGLMCNIYREVNYIPRNRPEVYKKCTELLFENWDKSRNIPVNFRYEDQVRPIIANLAYWIYSNTDFQKKGVTTSQLIQQAVRYYYPAHQSSQDAAERVANELIQFCTGRAWIFCDQGTTASGEDLYLFTHATFLEYFTAVYLTRKNDTPQKLFDALKLKIAHQEWDVVASIAFQIRSKEIEFAANKFCTLLISYSKTLHEDKAWNTIIFLFRSFQYMLPDLAQQNAAYYFLIRSLQVILNKPKNSSGKLPINQSEQLIAAILRMDISCRENFSNFIDDLLEKSVRTHKKDTIIVIIELLIVLSRRFHHLTSDEESSEFWQVKLDMYFAKYRDYLITTSKDSPFITYNLLTKYHFIALPFAINNHGISFVTESIGNSLGFGMQYINFISVMTSYIVDRLNELDNEYFHHSKIFNAFLRDFGVIILQTKISPHSVDIFPPLLEKRVEPFTSSIDITRLEDGLFGAICCFLILYETIAENKSTKRRRYDIEQILSENSIARPFTAILRARDLKDTLFYNDLLPEYSLTDVQKEFILSWISGKRSILSNRKN